MYPVFTSGALYRFMVFVYVFGADKVYLGGPGLDSMSPAPVRISGP